MTITLSALQQQRRDTASNWTSANPTLLGGEWGYETDTGKWKVGDGSTAWTSLAYVAIPDNNGLIPIDQLLLPLGSASAPSLAFDANTGLYSPGADQVAISTNGTGRLFVDASGNVGVKRSAPDNDLSIGSTGSLAQDANSFYIGSNFTGTGANFIGSSKHAQRLFFNNSSANGYLSYSNTGTAGTAGNPITWQERFRVTSDGKLGLGTSSPTHNLTIGHSLPQDYVLALRGGVGGFLGWDDSANCTILQAPNTRSLQFRVNSDTFSAGTMAMHINSSGNVGVGTTSPSQPIEVVTATGGGIAIRPSASNATQGLLWYDTGSGPWGFVKYDHQASALSFGTVNNERARIDSSGRLGLGTSSPSAKLHIDNAGGTLLSDLVLIKGGGGSGSGNLLSIQSNSADQLFAVNGLSYNVTMCSAGGRVGIGTTSPEHNLHVKDSSDGAVKIGGSNSTTGLTISYSNGGSTRTDIHQIYRSTSAAALMNIDTGTFTVSTGTAGQEKLRVDSSGRLLVGTSSESGNAKHVVRGNTGSATGAGVLDIGLGTTRPGSAGTALGYLRFTSTSNTASNYHYAAIHAETDGTSSSDTDIPGRLVFSTTADGASSPTERMRIDSSGNLLLRGLTSTWVSNYVGAIYNKGASPSLVIGRTDATGAASEAACIFTNSADNSVGSISISSTATAYNTSSDYRLKENVVPLTGAADRVNQLQVRRFNFIADPDKTVDGFLAHEAQVVVPECVTGEKDAVDDEGNPVYQGIDQSKLVPLLTAALQEALTEIESLKARVTALEP
jgi:hypothetical protein